MKHRINKVYLIVFIFLALLAVSVSAQNIIEDLLKPLEGLRIADTYERYFYVIDFFLFLIFFLGISRIGLEQRFEGAGGVWVIRTMGIILAVGMAIAEKRFNFNIGKLSPIILILFFVLLAYLLYYLFSSLGGGAGRTSAGITLFFIYIMYISTPELKAYIIKIPIVGNGVNALISLSLIVAIILVFWGLIGLFRGQGMGGGAPTPYTPAPPRVGGGGFRPRGTGLFSRMNPWSRYSKNKKATEAEDARLRQRETLTRQVRQIVASMGARYAIMQGNAGGANLNLVFRYLHALPGTPPPLGINAALINANRTVLMNTYTAYMNEWNALYNAIGEIYRLDAALRAQVITQLGRPI